MGKENLTIKLKKSIRCDLCGKLYHRNPERYEVWHDDEGFDVIMDTKTGKWVY